MNAVLPRATGANHFFICKNNERDVGTDVQSRLAGVGINSGNEVHSNEVHTMGISTLDHIFGHVLRA